MDWVDAEIERLTIENQELRKQIGMPTRTRTIVTRKELSAVKRVERNAKIIQFCIDRNWEHGCAKAVERELDLGIGYNTIRQIVQKHKFKRRYKNV